jgi:uncharacterized protein (DUF1499 family)
MARRPVFGDEPTSRLATWSGRFALFALAVAILSIVILRSGLLEIVPALATFGAALVFAVLAILFAFGAFIVIWRQGLDGLGRAFLGLFLGLALLAYPSYLGYRATKLPAIFDITTDATNPPRFEVLTRLRPRGRSDYSGQATAELQRKAYPDIAPLQLTVPPKLAYDAALAIVTKRKWLLVDSRAPAPGRAGAIEAVARTPIMGFREDVAIRVGTQGAGARIDVRSASRFGMHDLGSNASRIRALLEEIDEAAGVAEKRAEQQTERDEKKAEKKRPTDKKPDKKR